jgi:GTPase SAR1 family protein
VNECRYDSESGPGAVTDFFDGIVAVFDVTNKATLETFEPSGSAAQAIREWPGVARVLVGTKCDGDRKVTRVEGEGVAQRLGMRYFEASASTGAGVREAFDAAIRSAGEHCLLRQKTDRVPLATMMHKSSGFLGRRAPPCSCDCCVV